MDAEAWTVAPISTEKTRPLSELSRLVQKAVCVIRLALVSFIWLFIPSFLQSRGIPRTDSHGRNHIKFIDGLRGAAAFAVYMEHFISPLHPALLGPYTAEDSSSLLQLPFLRLVYSGSALVAVFFILSGFVLSRTVLHLTHEGKHHQAYSTLASSILKRGIVLYTPAVICTFFVMLACTASLYEDPLLVKFATRRPHVMPSFREQLIDWTEFTRQFMLSPLHFWPQEPSSSYGSHLWTISVLFSCSLQIFVTLPVIGLLRLRPALCVVSSLIIYNLVVGRQPMGLAYFGMLLACLSLKMTENISETTRSNLRPFAWASVACGLYLCSYPIRGYGLRPGYLDLWVDLRPITYYAVGAMILVGGLFYEPILQIPLTWPILLYLGKISFSLWIVHEPLLQIFGWKLFYTVEHSATVQELVWIYRVLILTAAWLALTIVIICLADFLWRAIELPSLAFAGWLREETLDMPKVSPTCLAQPS
jgi:peptidoglycan/LPS O-acetylase OafA/YrhL